MTTVQPLVATLITPTDVESCATCEHAVADHDAIALRFCRATLDGALTRGCICPSH